MAVYTEINQSEAQSIFNGLGDVENVKGITEGVENTNYIVTLNDQKKYILTIFEKRTKKTDLPFFNQAMNEFSQRDINCPIAITINNKNLFELKSKPCAIYSFIEGRPIEEFNSDKLNSLAVLTAKIHTAGLKSNLKRENDMLLPTWKLILNKFQNYEGDKKHEFIHVKNLINGLHDKFPLNIRRALIHADLFKDNIFYINNNISGVIDFFFACTDSIAYDLATLINAWFFQQEGFLENDFKTYFNSYLNYSILNSDEKKFFNFYLKCSAIRFFLTRLHDQYFNNSGQVNHKNPLDFFEILKFHEKNNLQDFF